MAITTSSFSGEGADAREAGADYGVNKIDPVTGKVLQSVGAPSRATRVRSATRRGSRGGRR